MPWPDVGDPHIGRATVGEPLSRLVHVAPVLFAARVGGVRGHDEPDRVPDAGL